MGNDAEGISTAGYTFLLRNELRTLYHWQTVVIGEDEIVVTVVASGPDAIAVEPVRSTHPAVIAFAREVDNARMLSDFINRSIESIGQSHDGPPSLESLPTG